MYFFKKLKVKTIFMLCIVGLSMLFFIKTSNMYYFKSYILFNPNEISVNCEQLFQGDLSEQEKAMNYTIKDNMLSDSYNYSNIIDCDSFINYRNYITSFTSVEETNFPIAFSILVHKDVGQFERLLRAIYRIQNVFCIHVDLKIEKHSFESIKRIASCFPNVFLASKRFDVQWGRFSVLQADMKCIKDLHNKNSTWKYLLNLTGQEFPLRTNIELVRILKAYRGANNLEGTIKRRNLKRIPKKKISFPVTWIKGAIHMTASRGFITYMLTSNRSRELLNVLKSNESPRHNGVKVPDEQFYATLNHNPKTLPAPGAYLGELDSSNVSYPFITRLKHWYGNQCQSKKLVRGVCIFGIKDLPYITKQPHLFINKLYWNFQPHALICLEERHRKRTMQNIRTNTVDFDLEYYSTLSFVKNHI